MGRDFKEKESDRDRIDRWINTSKDAFGLFTGVPNEVPIVFHLKYYGEFSRSSYDYQGRIKSKK